MCGKLTELQVIELADQCLLPRCLNLNQTFISVLAHHHISLYLDTMKLISAAFLSSLDDSASLTSDERAGSSQLASPSMSAQDSCAFHIRFVLSALNDALQRPVSSTHCSVRDTAFRSLIPDNGTLPCRQQHSSLGNTPTLLDKYFRSFAIFSSSRSNGDACRTIDPNFDIRRRGPCNILGRKHIR